MAGIAACNRNEHSFGNAAPLMAAQKVQSASGTLSQEHSLTIDVAESDLDSRFRVLTDRCVGDSEHHCTILQSDVQTGQFASGLIRLRIDPAAVGDLISFEVSLGNLEHRSTSVEDLAEAIQETQSRIEMLTNYRKQLLELQAKAGTNIEAAIKVASELSTVQSKLEQAAGTRRGSSVIGDCDAIPRATDEAKNWHGFERTAVTEFSEQGVSIGGNGHGILAKRVGKV
jgi:hypothetical protein